MSQNPLLTPDQCMLLLVDEQAGLAFAAGSADRQVLRNNAVALARTAVAFSVPVVVSTSATNPSYS
jgi:nicotinamidase-related amidase